MENNYTPINTKKFETPQINPVELVAVENNKFTLVLIMMATVAAAILASLLFFLIQKKIGI